MQKEGQMGGFFYTFPDFKSGAYFDWLEAVREDWKRDKNSVGR